MHHRLMIAALALALAAAVPGAAQTTSVPVPLQDLPVGETLGERLARWYGEARHTLGFGTRSLDIARQQSEPRGR